MNRRTFLISASLISALALVGLTGCAGKPSNNGAGAEPYQQVDAETAKEIMDTEEGYVVLDVRTQDEYDEGHIPGAVLMPHDTVATVAEDTLTDKDQLLLVYCRSGNRSKLASQALADLGYSNVVEFGGINSWPYDIER